MCRYRASISNRSLPGRRALRLRLHRHHSQLGRSQVQLLGRYWLITNGHGRETEVQGEGVVGEQPHIPAGGEYQYTSGAVIETPLGTMQGHYEMIDIDGAPFRIEIPVFRLAVPTLIH